MTIKKGIVLIVFTAVFAVNCASVRKQTTSSTHNVEFTTTPDSANVQIFESYNKPVTSCVSPCQVTLKTNQKYLAGPFYRVVIEKPGYKKKEVFVSNSINTWYWFNIILGGAIGMLIADPLTGAMWDMDPAKFDLKLESGGNADPGYYN